jgi:DNA-binding transcriptional regulator YiaG
MKTPKELTKTFKGILNLKYVKVQNVPVHKSERFGATMDAAVHKRVEKIAAIALLEQRVPLRGSEVQFLREVAGISQRKLGHLLGYSGVAILKWERSPNKRLAPVNEVAVRALMAGLLNIKLLGTFEALLGTEKSPKTLVLDFAQMQKKRVA